MINRNKTIAIYTHKAKEYSVLTEGVIDNKYFCTVLPLDLTSFLLEAWLGKKGPEYQKVTREMIGALTWLPIGLGDTIRNAESLLEDRLQRCVFDHRGPEFLSGEIATHQLLARKYITTILHDCKGVKIQVPRDLRNYPLILSEYKGGTDAMLRKYLEER